MAATAAVSSRSVPGPEPAAISTRSKTSLLARSAPDSLRMDTRGHVWLSCISPQPTHALAHDAHSPVHRPSTSRRATRSLVLHRSDSKPTAASVPLAARMPRPSARGLRPSRRLRQVNSIRHQALPGFRPIWGMSFAMISDTLHFVLAAISWYAALIADRTTAMLP